MIPWSYRLRDGVRVERAGAAWRVVSELPLCVMTVNGAAAQLLESTRTPVSVSGLAGDLGVPEEAVLHLCERFRARGLVEVLAPPAVAHDALAFEETPREAAPHEAAPAVSIVIPCRDRAEELEQCLRSLDALRYPADRREVIVVDDGSADGTAAVGRFHGCRVISNGRNRGQSYSRNVAAAVASGELLAFIDSDCVAHPDWLGELVPYFAWAKVAVVGGYVGGSDERSSLDRYELTMSSLNLGDRFLMAGDDVSTLYAPTCNLLVRREAYLGVGGINEDLRVGEDVDLCWRLRKTGSYLVYAPAGRVQHRHRSGLWATLKRRADYGTSEALLHDLHRDKRKRFVLPVAGVLGFAALVAGLLVNPWFLALAPVPALFEGARKVVRLRAERAGVRAPRVWFAVLRGHLSFLYFMLFHLVRYYLLVLLVAGVFAHRLWWLAAVALIYTALVDFWVKRPRLNAMTFLFYYAAEHAAYQAGVVAGCLRRHSFRSYLLSFRRGAGWAGGAGTSALGR